MHIARRDAGAAQALDHRLEALELFLGLLALIIAGGRKVRHQAFERRGRRRHRARDFLGRGAGSQTVHPGIDLQVIRDAHRGQILQRVNHRSQDDASPATRARLRENRP